MLCMQSHVVNTVLKRMFNIPVNVFTLPHALETGKISPQVFDLFTRFFKYLRERETEREGPWHVRLALMSSCSDKPRGIGSV